MSEIRDPLYREILDGLGNVDPDLFEKVMCGLLLPDFPTLVPVRGGNDAGFDGAIADGQSEPFSLIVTTAKDVARNVRRSLQRQKELGRARRKAVVVTSKLLTALDRRKLENLAAGLGSVLIQIYDREAIALRLLNEPRWRKELLPQVTGEPSALRVQTASRRPFLDASPVGRETDLQWLRETKGDRLLYGEPGSGKTFLLTHLAREGWGLFLASDDEGAIADAARKQRPRVVIVDDAHRDPERLDRLRGIRDETWDFEIVATTWTGRSHLDAVAAALGVAEPGPQAHRLELMTRNELVEVIRQVGIVGSSEFVRLLVDQADRKPGLAATLAWLALTGGEVQLREIVDGKALAKDVLGSFRVLVGGRVEEILACIALSGDRGMTMVAVAEGLGLPLVELRTAVIDLAAGGVLREVGEDSLAVWPRALRSALIGSVFFRGASSLPFRPLLGRANDFVASVGEIIDAAARGARVAQDLLRDLVVEAEDVRSREVAPYLDVESDRTAELTQSIRRGLWRPAIILWQKLAGLDRDQALWVLEHCPHRVVDLAPDALLQAPDVVIPRLLREAAQETVGHRAFERALQPLREWVQEIDARPRTEWLVRRRRLACLAKRSLEEGGGRRVALEAMAIAFSPALSGSSSDPGLGRTIQLQRGILPDTDLQELAELWGEVRGVLGTLEAQDWIALSGLLEAWIYPDQHLFDPSVPGSTVGIFADFANRLLADLTAAASGSPGLLGALRLKAERLGLAPPEPPDPDFALLFPGEHDREEIAGGETRQDEIARLAERWASEEPGVVAARLAHYHEEADAAGLIWPWRALRLCELLAQRVEPAAWLGAFLAEITNGAYLRPFLERIVSEGLAGWENWVEKCLAVPSARYLAVELVLSHPDPPAGLLDQGMDLVADMTQLVETLCLQGRVRDATLLRLLGHPSASVSVAAAVGTWCRQPRGQVPVEIGAAWREAVLRAQTQELAEDRARVGNDYWLEQIFTSDPTLAFDWLERLHRSGARPRLVFQSSLLQRAFSVLTAEQRGAFLKLVDATWPLSSVLPRVVRRDPALFRQILASASFRDVRLSPLRGDPDKEWWSLAEIAVGAGEAAGDIASEAFLFLQLAPIAGFGREHWEKWRAAFAERLDDPQAGIREVARAGVEEAERHIARSSVRERQAAIDGL